MEFTVANITPSKNEKTAVRQILGTNNKETPVKKTAVNNKKTVAKKPASPKKAVSKKIAVPTTPQSDAAVATLKKPEVKKALVKEGVQRVLQSPRERFLNNFIAKHKLTIPTPEVMFQDQIKRGWKLVPITQLAVFCNVSAMVNSKGAVGKAMDEVAPYFEDNNFLNLSAEIDPKQVEKVIKDLLEYGSLLHGVKVTTVTEVPETITYDPNILQVWDGRHRCVALAIIYGKELQLPVEISDMGYIKALNACIRSNDTRDLRKLEHIHFQGLKDGTDANVAYSRKDGSIKKIAEMVVAHSLKQVPAPVLKPVESVKVREKLSGTKGITAVNYTNCVKEALRMLESDFNLYILDKNTAAVFNLTTTVFEAVWLAIDAHSNGIKASTAWNAYSSILLGRVIGRAIHYWGAKNIRPTEDVIKDFAGQLATVVCNFMDSQAELYARTPQGKLEPIMMDFAEKKLGVILPRIQTASFVPADEEGAPALEPVELLSVTE